MARYAVYVDGFNVFYALKWSYRQFLWLNYRALAETVLGPKDSLTNTIYFSALAKWKPNDVKQHQTFIKAQRWAGVEVVLGKFREKEIACHLCHQRFRTHKEKRTDVNIAVRVVADAVKDLYDRAVLVTADSDLIPAIQTVHELAPAKQIGVMIPIGRNSYDLKNTADFIKKMPQAKLKHACFPQSLPRGMTRFASHQTGHSQ
ncbi:MAG: NYN domain-containing protein [Acidobacteria bacterium]|nr:NYN domain-containing protein [Acidobacteriota bacterium]